MCRSWCESTRMIIESWVVLKDRNVFNESEQKEWTFWKEKMIMIEKNCFWTQQLSQSPSDVATWVFHEKLWKINFLEFYGSGTDHSWLSWQNASSDHTWLFWNVFGCEQMIMLVILNVNLLLKNSEIWGNKILHK